MEHSVLLDSLGRSIFTFSNTTKAYFRVIVVVQIAVVRLVMSLIRLNDVIRCRTSVRTVLELLNEPLKGSDNLDESLGERPDIKGF